MEQLKTYEHDNRNSKHEQEKHKLNLLEERKQKQRRDVLKSDMIAQLD